MDGFFHRLTGFFIAITAAGRSQKQFMLSIQSKKGSAATYSGADRREQQNATFHKSTHCVYSRPQVQLSYVCIVQKYRFKVIKKVSKVIDFLSFLVYSKSTD